MNKCRKIIILIVLGCFFCSWVAADKQHKAFRSFWHPMYQGERLDYCSVTGSECGKVIAHKYCQSLGYDYASQNVIAYNIGLTNFLNSRAQCKGWRCNGFMTIDCASNISHVPPKPYHYREKRFAYPRYNEYRVDWCYKQNAECGKKAANSFCSRMGFMQAKHFVKEAKIAATKTIGSQELCFGSACDAFKMIVCYR